MSNDGLLTASEIAKKWGVTPRRVQGLCASGELKGAQRFGRAWMIPYYAVLPSSAKGKTPHMPMPKKSPFLDMTDLYNQVGNADKCVEMLINNPEAHALFKAQIAYRRGEIDYVYNQARYFLDAHSGFYAILGGGMLLALCAIWRGDFELWREAKKHICSAPCDTESKREIISLALAVVNSSIYNNKDFPEWFTIGNFETLPADSHPATHVFYVKYLYMMVCEKAFKQAQVEKVQKLSLIRMLPKIIEPLITHANVQKNLLCEIYLRFSCAVVYYNLGEKQSATKHIDKALKLALADNFFGVIAEYVKYFDGMLEERIQIQNSNCLPIIKSLYANYNTGLEKLSVAVQNSNPTTSLTAREREVAKLVAFGYTNKEIASMLYLSESTVKQTVMRVVLKTGASDRSEFVYIL